MFLEEITPSSVGQLGSHLSAVSGDLSELDSEADLVNDSQGLNINIASTIGLKLKQQLSVKSEKGILL